MPELSTSSRKVPDRLLWGPTPASPLVDGAQHLERWRRRTWQLHGSVLLSHLYAFALFAGHAGAGYAPWPAVWVYGLWLLCGMGFITWAYASGWCHTRRDPGMFLTHQLVSIFGVLGMLVAAPQVAFQALVMLIVFSADGFLARSRTSFWLTWIATLAAVTALICWLGPRMRMTTDTQAGQLLAIAVVLGAVVRCSVLVTFFRSMQYRIAVANEKLATALAQIEVLVRQDEVTGVANRRGVMERLQQCRAVALRQQGPLCVALLDIDHFKRINDSFGHEGGDRVLRAFGTLLTSQLRASDGIGRYGGEEFLLVLPDTDLARAGELLERLRQRIAQAPWAQTVGAGARVTATFGAAQYRPGESVEATIARADAAMYGGKAAGRNRVVLEAEDRP
ncbi:MAG: GGDEF domain-containing protein [Burkholderiaceae bacterium]|jgi:diguanylate cyclase (GGDEF)-like protein|nr:GGDEF domain-containing protein [Burkholderiaceae bacterium]